MIGWDGIFGGSMMWGWGLILVLVCVALMFWMMRQMK